MLSLKLLILIAIVVLLISFISLVTAILIFLKEFPLDSQINPAQRDALNYLKNSSSCLFMVNFVLIGACVILWLYEKRLLPF